MRDWKNIKFDYMLKDRVIAKVEITNGVVKVEHTKGVPKSLALWNARNDISLSDIYKQLSFMVFSRERVNRDELLEMLGIEEYDPKAIVEKTHGVIATNYYWIRFEGENLTCRDVREWIGLDF